MSKALDKVFDLVKQKFPDSTGVNINISKHGMSTSVHYQTGYEVDLGDQLNGNCSAANITTEEE